MKPIDIRANLSPTACEACGQEYTRGVSCTCDGIRMNGKNYRRIKVQEDFCVDCGAPKGGYHHALCDDEDCPKCGSWFGICDCAPEGAVPFNIRGRKRA